MIWAVNIRGKAEGKAAGPDETPFHPGVQRGASGKLTSRRRTHAAIRSRPVANLEWKRRRSAAFPVAKKALDLPAPLQSPVWGCLKKGRGQATVFGALTLHNNPWVPVGYCQLFWSRLKHYMALKHEASPAMKLLLSVCLTNWHWSINFHCRFVT